MGKGEVVLKSDIPDILRATPARVRQVVTKAAYEVAAVAGPATPVDTGALKNSLFVSIDSDSEATVGYTAEYAAFVELGHNTRAGRYVPGHYMLTGGVNKVEPSFRAAIKQAMEG